MVKTKFDGALKILVAREKMAKGAVIIYDQAGGGREKDS